MHLDSNDPLSDFIGVWEVDTTNQNYFFSIHMFCDSGKLVGQHCFISNSRDKIDGDADDNLSLFLEKHQSKIRILIRVTSAFSEGSALVELKKIKKDELVWNLIMPLKGEAYFPVNTVLQKGKEVGQI